MTTRKRATAAGSVLWLAAAGLAALVVAGGIGAYPTHRLAGSAGLVGLVAGCGIAWIAAVLGFVPGCLMLERAPQNAAKAFLAGSAIRFGVAVLLALPVALADVLETTPLLLWVAIGYMVVLLVDTTLVVSLVNRSAGKHDNDGSAGV